MLPLFEISFLFFLYYFMKRYITGDGFCAGTLCLTVPYDMVQPIKKGE
jgi:hypothetical protein